MKKIIFGFLIFVLIVLLNTAVLAKTGDVAENIYSTDILAYINDVPVRSYCIDGKTAIILEDLLEYGFYCGYSGKLRTLAVNTSTWDLSLQKQVSRGKAGNIVGKIYETDIKTYVNGVPIKAYAINGKIAVTIEDLGEITDGSAYSPYNMKCVWNGKDRTIKLYFLYNNASELFYLLNGKPLRIFNINNEMEIYTDFFYSGGIGSYYDLNPPPSSPFPIYYNGQKVGIGFHQKIAHIYFKWNWEAELAEEKGFYAGVNYDLDAMKKIIEKIKITKPTYEEVLEYYERFEKEDLGRIKDRIDTDEYTFLYIVQYTNHGGTEFLVWINRSGEYKDYSKDFESVSFYGQKFFDNVKIDAEKETVTFGYDVYYIIDLKTGKMSQK